MTNSEKEIESLIQAGDSQEAGVAEALELYLQIEEIYVKASQASINLESDYVSSSTNFPSY